MAMEDEVQKSVLRLVTAQICLSLGWHSVTRCTLEMLTDIIERYLKKVSNKVAGTCQHDGRLCPTIDDISFVFNHLGISSLELEDYLHQVEQAPLCRGLPLCPAPKTTSFKYAEDEENRPEHIESHFPPLVKLKAIKDEEPENVEQASANEVIPETLDTNEPLGVTKLPPLSSRKRSYDSPPYSPIEPKRLNLDAQQLVPDLTRPDLKVSTPKELTVVSSADDRLKGHSKASSVPRYLHERLDNALKAREVNTSSKKEPAKKETEKKGPLKLSPAKEFSPREKIPVPPIKGQDREQKPFLSPVKPTVDKEDWGTSSMMSPRSQGSLVVLSSPKLKPEKSPKAPKVARSPIAPETGIKSSFLIPKGSSSPIIPPPISNPPKAEKTKITKKKVKVVKGAEKGTEGGKEKKKKKKVPAAESLEGEKSTMKLKISPLQVVKKKPHKEKKKIENLLAPPLSLFTSHASDAPSEKLSVPKLVFKSLPPSSDSPKLTTGDSLISKETEKQKVKIKKKSQSAELKKKLKISFAEDKPSKQGKGDDKKSGKIKKKKKIKTAMHLDDSSKGKVTPGIGEKELGPSMKLKFNTSSDEGIKMSFSTSMVRPSLPSPKKRPSELYVGAPPMFPQVVAISRPPESEPPAKKPKIEKPKKKKSLDVMESKGSDGVKVPKKSKESKKDGSVKSTKPKKHPKVSDVPPAIQPIPKLTLKMDASSSITEAAPPSKLILKPLQSPTKPSPTLPTSKKTKNVMGTKMSTHPPPPTTKKPPPMPAPPPAPLSPTAGPTAAGALDDTPQRGVFTVTLAQTSVASAEVYYCPACQRPDDGSPMIGCDGCDLWYHWPCVGVFYAPRDDEQWFCPACSEKQKKKKKKKKKDS